MPPNDLDGFVQRVLELGRDAELTRQFGEAGRAQALLATWERIGNRVAWKMLDALEGQERTTEGVKNTFATTIPQRNMSIVDSRLTGPAAQGGGAQVSFIARARTFLSLLLIVSCWGVIGICLAVIKSYALGENSSWKSLGCILNSQGQTLQ